MTMRVRVDIRRYVGTHDVVSGIIRGAADPQDELWVLAHSAEPGGGGSGMRELMDPHPAALAPLGQRPSPPSGRLRPSSTGYGGG